MKIKATAAALMIISALLCSCTSIDETSEASGELNTIPRDYVTQGTYDPDALPPVSLVAENTETVISEELQEEVPPSEEIGKYIYNSLSSRERKFYDELKAAAENCEDKVYYSEDIDYDTARKIFTAVYNQEPQLFWLDGLFYPPADNTQLLQYRFSAEELPEAKADTEAAAEKILAPAESMSAYNKVVYIHDYLVRSLSFLGQGEENLTVYSALCYNKAQCEGYAFTFKYLCTKAGIDCITVPGSNGADVLHAWNMVKLDDIWYNVDCTWDDPIITDVSDSSDFLRRYYLLVPDSDILNISHFRNDEYFVYPSCYDGSRTYYAREGMLASSSDEGIAMLEDNAAQELSQGHRDAEVRFSSSSDYHMAAKLLFDMGDIKRLANSARAKAGLDSDLGTAGMVKYLNDELYIIHITF